MHENGLRAKAQSQDCLDLTVTEKTDPTQFLGLLRRIGLKTQLTRKEGSRDEQVHYRIDQATFNDPDRLNVLASLSLKCMRL